MTSTTTPASKKQVHFAVEKGVPHLTSSHSAMEPTKGKGRGKQSKNHSRHDSMMSSGTDDNNARSTSVESTGSSSSTITEPDLAKLKSGPRVNVFVGPIGNQFIGIEGAYVNIFTQFSGLARKQLIEEDSKNLSLPGVPKHIAKYIYLHMLNEEKPNVPGNPTFSGLRVPDLIAVYHHCKTIGYDALMDKIIPRLRYKIKDYTNLLSAEQLAGIFEYLPEFQEIAVDNVARAILMPLTMDYTQYHRLEKTNPDVELQLNWAVMDALKQRLPMDHMKTVTACEAYYRAYGPFGKPVPIKAVKPASAKEPIDEAVKPEPVAAVAPEPVQSASKPVVKFPAAPDSKKAVKKKVRGRCWGCGQKGHSKSACPSGHGGAGAAGLVV